MSMSHSNGKKNTVWLHACFGRSSELFYGSLFEYVSNYLDSGKVTNSSGNTSKEPVRTDHRIPQNYA